MNHWLVDGMSLVHLVIGVGFRLFRVPLWLTLAVAITWEVAEHVLKIHWPQMFLFPSQDTVANAVGDILCALVGWKAAAWISAASGRRRARRTAR